MDYATNTSQIILNSILHYWNKMSLFLLLGLNCLQSEKRESLIKLHKKYLHGLVWLLKGLKTIFYNYGVIMKTGNTNVVHGPQMLTLLTEMQKMAWDHNFWKATFITKITQFFRHKNLRWRDDEKCLPETKADGHGKTADCHIGFLYLSAAVLASFHICGWQHKKKRKEKNPFSFSRMRYFWSFGIQFWGKCYCESSFSLSLSLSLSISLFISKSTFFFIKNAFFLSFIGAQQLSRFELVCN